MATGQVCAQLNDFTITASATPQTCLGNGTVSFTVSGNNTAAALEFAVYLLPNTTVPFTTVTAMSAQNLVAGDYLIIATQTLNGQSNTATANATVGDNTVPLVYTLTTTNIGCGEGSITVNVTSGNAVQYEIISGPVTVPLQTSNVFTGLPAGQYQVRVHNNCGDAFTTTVQLITGSNSLQIKEGGVAQLASCNTIKVYHHASTTSAIAWPLQLEYTVYGPTGDPQVITDTATGPGQIVTEIPFNESGTYVYYIETTDACGNVFNDGPFIISGYINFAMLVGYQVCDPTSIIVRPSDYLMYPLTFNFIEAPEDFNPVDFNASYPLFEDFQTSIVFEGGVLPYGDYTLEITDACGRVIEREVVVGPNIHPPQVVVTYSCQLGTVDILTIGKAITGLVVTHAPEAYEPQLPHELLGNSDPQYGFVINGLPEGDYTLHLTDECDNEFDLQIVINTPPANILVQNLPGCSEGLGSVSAYRPAKLLQPLPLPVRRPLLWVHCLLMQQILLHQDNLVCLACPAEIIRTA
ncbi:hypothetical protein AM493_17385 [Flavobacterium akiainvivens]|uniref:Uncharacterized protein n=2 Tax=Flavobacterium akiainvivens TaxID=1202724 RepID=A0A0M8MD09_9FLAO|nr:hypothetical protein AM493_17385 [Flavobacterium akiainvivens]